MNNLQTDILLAHAMAQRRRAANIALPLQTLCALASSRLCVNCLCAFLLCGSLTLTGCKVGPNYVRPDVVTPPAYRDAPDGSADEASLADRPWWEVFSDPALVALIDEALRNNYDLRIAIARIEQERGIRAQTRSGLFPQLDYNGGISRGKNEFLGTPAPNGGATDTAAAVGLSAFWELDVWGRIRRADEAALARILASEEDRRAVMLSLVSDVALAYFELLGLDLQMEIARRNTDSFGASLQIFQQRAAGGVDSDLPVMRARASQADAAATVPQVERDIAITENALNVLLGRLPQPIARPRTLAEQFMPPDVPVGIPSQLLARRPDIRTAEQFMIAANAEIGVAIAQYFPQFSLTGALGQASPQLSSFDSGASSVWSIAAGLTGPLFQGGRLKGQEVAARAVMEETVAAYQQVVLQSMKDVSDALIAREKLVEIEAQQVIAVDSLNQAVKLATDRFLGGLSSYFEVLEAQQELFPAEQALADTRTQKMLVLVQLYRALGGGWNLTDGEWASESAGPTSQPTAPQPDAGEAG